LALLFGIKFGICFNFWNSCFTQFNECSTFWNDILKRNLTVGCRTDLPDIAMPLIPTPIVRKLTATDWSVVSASAKKNAASMPKPKEIDKSNTSDEDYAHK